MLLDDVTQNPMTKGKIAALVGSDDDSDDDVVRAQAYTLRTIKTDGSDPGWKHLCFNFLRGYFFRDGVEQVKNKIRCSATRQ